MERVAIIDLGSNTARLLLVDVKDNGHFQIVDQLKEAPRLGEGMERDGFLKPARIQETIKTLKKRSENILKNKEDLDKYYLKIEEIKNDYKEFINKSSIITTLLFIKHGINVISEKSD